MSSATTTGTVTMAPQQQQPPVVSSSFLHGDVLARILGFLDWRQVLRCRRVCATWKTAVTHTPVAEMVVVLATADRHPDRGLRRVLSSMPRLRSLTLEQRVGGTPLTDEDVTDALTPLRHLRHLTCRETTSLRHCLTDPAVFTSTLVSLNLHNCQRLQWRLDDVATRLPHLTDLRAVNNRRCHGTLSDLRPLASRRLEVLDLSGCTAVTGDWLDLARHDDDDDTASRLRWFGFTRTAVHGDVRDLLLPPRRGQTGEEGRRHCSHHYPALRALGLPHTVYGAGELRRVHHAADVMRARHVIRRQSTTADDDDDVVVPIYPFRLRLSEHSPDYHERVEQRLYASERDPPFHIEQIVVADGVRCGWRWSNLLGGCCAIHWLDPEPTTTNGHPSHAVDAYETELAQIREECADSLFSDFWDPPTPEEYERLCRERL